MSRHPEADLLEKTRLYATVRGKDKAFIPHPSTWFNQDRFLDDPETWKPKAPAGGVPKKREEFCG
jgi:hypothetical protein